MQPIRQARLGLEPGPQGQNSLLPSTAYRSRGHHIHQVRPERRPSPKPQIYMPQQAGLGCPGPTSTQPTPYDTLPARK